MSAALAAAYTAGRGSWQPAELGGVQTLATANGMQVTVLDHTGHRVATMRLEHHDGRQR